MRVKEKKSFLSQKIKIKKSEKVKNFALPLNFNYLFDKRSHCVLLNLKWVKVTFDLTSKLTLSQLQTKLDLNHFTKI